MKIAILGAGIAGLTAGYKLKDKHEVIIFEKEPEVGGLSRTININGNRYDLGGHRFWTKKDEINQFLKDLLKDELLEVPRSSKIFFNSKLFDYPLKFSAIFSLGLLRTAVTGIDFLIGRTMFHLRPNQKIVSFEDYIVRQFGLQLYKFFFRDYTEKIWGIPCAKLSSEWAVQRIKGLTVTEIIKGMLFPPKDVATLTTRFFYPKLGIARIAEKMAEGLDIKHEAVKDMAYKGNKIVSVNGETADLFISTIPITELASMLDPDEEVRNAIELLRYRDIAFLFITFKGDVLTKESWIYFPNPEVPFGRMHEPKNWSKHMCKKGQSSVVIEFFCNKGDYLWNSSNNNLLSLGIGHLKKLGIWKDQEIIDVDIQRIEKCYPMYEIGYEEYLNKVKQFLSRYNNLVCIGRNGTFKYLNIDHVLEMGIKCAENIAGAKYVLNLIGSEKEYQEEKNEGS